MRLRVAIASSGLGHVRRGVESWANDLALALHAAGADITLFQGGRGGTEPWRHALPCIQRFKSSAARVLSITGRCGGWRYGAGSEYEIEQTTFALSLWRRVRGSFDVLHVQDPLLALQLQFLHRRGWSRPSVILAHGTEEPDSFLKRFSYLQHLAPCYDEAWRSHKPAEQLSFAVPNFVDTELFVPGDRDAARAEWNLPADTLIILSVAALKNTHKRCDYLIREFLAFREAYGGPALLVMAGGQDKETPAVLEIGRSLLGDSVRILGSIDREKLRSLYRAADIYALASLREMMPIAVLEALSSGLPITCNSTPTLEWMAGPGGVPEDISKPGGLVRQWLRLAARNTRALASAAARRHAEETFSAPVVLAQIEEMYGAVAEDARRRAGPLQASSDE
jgi:glycosyltransferase involved in cell wall biosynthesis